MYKYGLIYVFVYIYIHICLAYLHVCGKHATTGIGNIAISSRLCACLVTFQYTPSCGTSQHGAETRKPCVATHVK